MDINKQRQFVKIPAIGAGIIFYLWLKAFVNRKIDIINIIKVMVYYVTFILIFAILKFLLQYILVWPEAIQGLIGIITGYFGLYFMGCKLINMQIKYQNENKNENTKSSNRIIFQYIVLLLLFYIIGYTFAWGSIQIMKMLF